jgi:hypothetical protein
MPGPQEMNEDEAYKKFTAALRRGQAGLDELDPEVKKMAMGPAEASLDRKGYDLTKEELESPDREGFTPVVEPPSDEVDRKGYDLTKEELASPDREGSTPVVSPPREEYKGFMAPSGMSDKQTSAWKAGIDDRLLDKPERIQERIEGEHPKEQLMDIIRRASEGDMEAIKDMGYFGLNVASMVGPQQAAADLGVGAMDLAEGDYAGAAMSGAAAVLPVISAGMAKQIMKGDFGEKARELYTGAGDAEYRMNQELLKTRGEMVGGALEEKEEMDWLLQQARNAVRAEEVRRTGGQAFNLDELREKVFVSETLGSAEKLKVLKGEYGDEAKELYIGIMESQQAGSDAVANILRGTEDTLTKSPMSREAAILDARKIAAEVNDDTYKLRNLLIQNSPDIAPMDMAKLDSDLMDATGHSLDDIIEAAKQGKTLPTNDEMLYKSAQHRSTDPWEKDTFVSDQQKAYEAEK